MSEHEARDIRERAYEYGLRAIKLYQYLQKQRDGAGWVLGGNTFDQSEFAH